MIVLYNPPSTHSTTKPLPMSLLALAGQLEGHFDWTLVDGNLSPDPVAEIEAIHARNRIEALGVTVMPGPQLSRSVPDCGKLKARFPEIPIVWGGYFPSQHDEACLRSGLTDFCLRGQGERAFLQLLRILTRGGSLTSVPGLSWMEGEVVRRNPAAPLSALDELPDWPYSRISMEPYLHDHYMGRRVVDHQSSFGCPFGCNFCAVVEISKRRWVAQSPERVGKIVAGLYRDYRIDSLMFHDMDFFINQSRSSEIAERITPYNLRWWAMGRIDELLRFSESTWEKLRRSGLKMVFCGAEAGSDEALDRMNKGGSAGVDRTLELARLLRHYGIVPEFSFVVGLPPNPREDVERTIDFTRRVKQVNPETELIFYQYTPVPAAGSLTEAAEKEGFQFPASLEEWLRPEWFEFAMRRHRQAPWLDRKVGRRISDYEAVVNARFPTSTNQDLSRLQKRILQTFGKWRYRTRAYAYPVELRALQRLMRYRRPETTGF